MIDDQAQAILRDCEAAEKRAEIKRQSPPGDWLPGRMAQHCRTLLAALREREPKGPVEQALDIVRRFQQQHPGKRLALMPDGKTELVNATPGEEAASITAVVESLAQHVRQQTIAECVATLEAEARRLREYERTAASDADWRRYGYAAHDTLEAAASLRALERKG